MRLNPQPRRTLRGAVALSILLVILLVTEARATPMYAARSGRTCDNCHVTPNNWVNPPLEDRKCTLSCQGCHVDPAGGGMRTVSGRYYGRATLPAVATSPRPTADWDRNAPRIGRRDKATSYSDVLPEGPHDFDTVAAWRDSIDDPWAWGMVSEGSSRRGFWQGRYHTLNADPVLRVGGDARLAVLVAGQGLVFPMQVDIGTVLHPIHHLTLLVNTGARGRTSGYGDTFSADQPFYFREAFLMAHEAPYQSYVKVGRFVPSFGLRLDDHTSSIRRQFELDGALPESRVTGVEVGAAPNYPFLQASYFHMASRERAPDAWDIFDVDDGWGTAVNLGYRDETWSVGASMLVRRRPLAEGGDTETIGGYAVLNPWYRVRHVPLTYQIEYDYGRYQRASGRETNHSALYQELDYLLFNGINLLVAHDWVDPDHEVGEDSSHRLQFGGQITPWPGVTLDMRVRSLTPAGGGADADLFFQVHVWQ